MLYIQQLKAGMLPILWAVNIIHRYTQRKTRGFFSLTVPSFLPSPLLFTSHQTNALTMNSHLLLIFGGKMHPRHSSVYPPPHRLHSQRIFHLWGGSQEGNYSVIQKWKGRGEAWEVRSKRSCFGCKDLIYIYIFFFLQVVIFTRAMRKVSFKKPKETKNHSKIVALLPIFTTSLSKLSFCAENFFKCLELYGHNKYVVDIQYNVMTRLQSKTANMSEFGLTLKLMSLYNICRRCESRLS